MKKVIAVSVATSLQESGHIIWGKKKNFKVAFYMLNLFYLVLFFVNLSQKR